MSIIIRMRTSLKDKILRDRAPIRSFRNSWNLETFRILFNN